MINRRLFAGLLMFALTGCGLYASAQSKVYTIDEIFALVESNSVRLRPSLTTERETKSGIDVARSARLPEINLDLSLSYIGDGFTTKRNFSDYQKAPIPHFGSGLSISIAQPVYTGGAVTAGIHLAELEHSASRFAAELNRESIRFQVAGFYLDIYKCKNLLKVVESNISAARKVLDEMHSRYRQGTVLKNDITRYELLISNLELQHTKLVNTHGILNTNLVTVSGLPEGTIVEPDSSILMRSLPRENEDWWQAEATAHSPKLKLARTSVEMSRKSESLVKSGRRPTVSLLAGWNIDGPILVEVPPINRNLSYWFVGLGVKYNLSSLYKTDKSLTRSRLATLKAQEEYDAMLENVNLDVNADHVRYLEAYQELRTQEKSVELAALNYDTTLRRYNADMALITDMLDAANAKLDAEERLVNSRINIIFYYYKLLFTSGKI